MHLQNSYIMVTGWLHKSCAKEPCSETLSTNWHGHFASKDTSNRQSDSFRSTTERRISNFLCLVYCNYLVFGISTLFFKAVCIFLYIHRSTTIFYKDADINTTPFPSQNEVFTCKTIIVTAKLTVSTWKLSNETSLYVKGSKLGSSENFSSSWVELLHCATRCQKQPTSPCSPLWEKSCVYNRVHLNYWYHRDCFDFRLDCLPLPSYLTDEDEDADEAMAATAALSFVKALRTSSLSSEKRIRLTCWSSGVPVSRKIRSVDSSLRNLSRTSEQCGKYRLPSSTGQIRNSSLEMIAYYTKYLERFSTEQFSFWTNRTEQF